LHTEYIFHLIEKAEAYIMEGLGEISK